MTLLASFVLAPFLPAVAVPGPVTLDQGYAVMYNLNFRQAHRDFEEWEHTNPNDPMGPASDAAADLFSEFARLHVLESEFLTDDTHFSARERSLRPDPAAKGAFETALAKAQKLAREVLAHSPDDEHALLASVLAQGLHADYLALIEGKNLAALSEMKQSRALAERLLQLHPDCYDAYLAVGVENYLLSLKPAPVRWILRMGGAETDKQAGLARLRLTAEHGHYLLPYARLLLAVAALRDGDRTKAKELLSWLCSNFPANPLYEAELAKLK